MRFFLTLFVLLLFLLLRLPPLRERVDFGVAPKGGSSGASADTVLIVCSAITLSTPLGAGPTHSPSSGENRVGVLQGPLLVSWAAMLLSRGVLLLAVVARGWFCERRLAVMGRRVWAEQPFAASRWLPVFGRGSR